MIGHWLWVGLRTFLELDAVLWVAITALGLWLLGLKAGIRYSWTQLLGTCVATPIGWVILIWPCATHAWTEPIVPSLKPLPGREKVDQWAGFWAWLNSWAGNREDSASGKQALLNDGSNYTPFMPLPTWITWRWAIWIFDSIRAWCWSAWRNSADELKYVFAWPAGTNVSGTWLLGRPYLIGW